MLYISTIIISNVYFHLFLLMFHLVLNAYFAGAYLNLIDTTGNLQSFLCCIDNVCNLLMYRM